MIYLYDLPQGSLTYEVSYSQGIDGKMIVQPVLSGMGSGRTVEGKKRRERLKGEVNQLGLG